jgi:hypothetical protein
MVTASVATGEVANAVADRTVEAGTVAARLPATTSANQRTVFMVGHVLTQFVIVRGDRGELLRIDRLPRGGQRR